MRKATFLLVLSILLVWAAPVYAQLKINGKSAVLIDAASGQVLYDQNKDEQLPPASTTKILTSIIAIESGRLDETVTIGPNPPKVDGTKVYLVEGEQIKLRDLVMAAMIHSANDAALAIAEHLAGSQEEFAKLMNAKAQELGALHTHFVNPHGLSEEGHYTTAYDLALIGRYAMQNETFRQIASSKILDWEGQAWQTRLININKMLWNYDGANGIKTGYTSEAKSTIVASAVRDDRSYIAVVLGSTGNALWNDAAALLDYGFAKFQQIKLANAGDVVATVNMNEEDKLQLVSGQEFSLSLPVEKSKQVETKLHLQPLQGKIVQGQIVGELAFTVDGEELGRVELLAANDIKPPFKLINIVLYISTGLFFLQIFWRSLRRMRRRRRRGYSYNPSGAYRRY